MISYTITYHDLRSAAASSTDVVLEVIECASSTVSSASCGYSQPCTKFANK